MLEAICVHYIVWPVLRTSNAIFLTWYKTCMSVEQVESIIDDVVLFCEIYYINSFLRASRNDTPAKLDAKEEGYVLKVFVNRDAFNASKHILFLNAY